MKILNLYAGIGGNRKLWGNDHEITAVEFNKEVAEVYKSFFPNDKVIIGDAHQYLLDHVREYEFIWSSPPCPTHSRMRLLMAEQEGKKFKFPDMKLWEEIIFLKHFAKGKYCVENVVTYYKPFVIPKKLGNHYYWSNFNLGDIIYIGLDVDASATTGIPVAGGDIFSTNWPIDFRSKVTVLAAQNTPALHGVIWGIHQG